MTEYEQMLLEYEEELYKQQELNDWNQFLANLTSYIEDEKIPFAVVDASNDSLPVYFYKNKDEFMNDIKNVPLNASIYIFEYNGKEVVEKAINDYKNVSIDDFDR